MGALTYMVTPLTTLVVALPFLLMTGFREGAGLEVIAKALHLEGLGGFFVAMMILGLLFWLFGILATGFISWRVYRSRSLAALTMAAAFGFQVVGAVVTYAARTWTEGRDIATMDSAFEAADARIRDFASLGAPEVSVRGRRDHWGDSYPQFGPYYEYMDVALPVLVRQPGTYHVEAQYQGAHPEIYNSGSSLDTTLALQAGRDTLRLSFRASMYRSPAYTGGRAWAETRYVMTDLDYLAMAMPMMRIAGGRRRELEKEFQKYGRMTREEFVDSSSVAIPQSITNYIPPPDPPNDYDDRGRPLRRPQGRR